MHNLRIMGRIFENKFKCGSPVNISFRLYPSSRKACLIQLSPAASERVFSLLKNSFNEQQQISLQDYIVMMLYNGR